MLPPNIQPIRFENPVLGFYNLDHDLKNAHHFYAYKIALTKLPKLFKGLESKPVYQEAIASCTQFRDERELSINAKQTLIGITSHFPDLTKSLTASQDIKPSEVLESYDASLRTIEDILKDYASPNALTVIDLALDKGVSMFKKREKQHFDNTLSKLVPSLAAMHELKEIHRERIAQADDAHKIGEVVFAISVLVAASIMYKTRLMDVNMAANKVWPKKTREWDFLWFDLQHENNFSTPMAQKLA